MDCIISSLCKGEHLLDNILHGGILFRLVYFIIVLHSFLLRKPAKELDQQSLKRTSHWFSPDNFLLPTPNFSMFISCAFWSYIKISHSNNTSSSPHIWVFFTTQSSFLSRLLVTTNLRKIEAHSLLWKNIIWFHFPPLYMVIFRIADYLIAFTFFSLPFSK